MESVSQFTLLDVDRVLPIANRDLFLRWIKDCYVKAQDAMDYGFAGATIVQKDDFVITAEDMLMMIDIKRGRIGQRGAQLLIGLCQSGALPKSLVIEGQRIPDEFYRYAYPGDFQASRAS